MGIAERQAREKEALRQKILEAAGRLFVEDGLESVSIRRIAERIEYAPSTIYLYFKDKRELLRTICLDTFTALNQKLAQTEQAVLAGMMTPLEGLKSVIGFYIEFGLEHPHHYQATFNSGSWQRLADEMKGEEPVEMPGIRAFEMLRSAVERCMEAGAIRRADLVVTCQSIWMMMHGVTLLLIPARARTSTFPWADYRQLIDRSMDILIRGLQ